MNNEEITDIVVQGARYLQAAQQDRDLNLQLTHYNYAVIYFEIALRYASPELIRNLTNIDARMSLELAKRGQNAVNMQYMRRMAIPVRVPFVR